MTLFAGDSGSPLSKSLREVLASQVIVVTGADQGYGRLIAAALAYAGASVILIGTAPETLAAIASGIEQQGGRAIPMTADVSVALDWVSALDRILGIYGSFDGVVHLADKRAHSSRFQELSEGEWLELFSANVKSAVTIAQVLRRRQPEAWLTIVGPHQDEDGLHAHPQRGALRGLVEHAASEELRLNLLFPSRASSGEDGADRALSNVVVTLATPGLSHLRGNVLDVPLPPVPSLQSRAAMSEGRA